MKITVDIDCTPQEARQLMGLPDVSDMQDEIVEEMKKRILAGLEATDPQAMMRMWGSPGGEGWEQLQKMFWAGVESATGGAKGKKS